MELEIFSKIVSERPDSMYNDYFECRWNIPEYGRKLLTDILLGFDL